MENESSGESAHAARVSAVEPGARLANRYVVRARLGAGGMGVVLLAFDERLGREVALKVLAPQAVGDAVARERLLREARSAAGLEHPGIVRVYDVGATEDGGVFVVMERVLGHTFHHLLERRLLPLGAALDVLAQVARGLGHAHRLGYVHRDVKPENVMVRDDGSALILDFGLAKPVAGHGPAASLTAAGGFIGTPAYVAPEQAVGGETDGRADVFSLAVMAYEVLAGTLPWPEGNPIATIMSVLTFSPPAASSVAPGLPAGVDPVLERGMAKRPQDRYATPEAFVDAILAVPGLAEAGLLARHAAASPRSSAASGRVASVAFRATVPSGDFSDDVGRELRAGSGSTPLLRPSRERLTTAAATATTAGAGDLAAQDGVKRRRWSSRRGWLFASAAGGLVALTLAASHSPSAAGKGVRRALPFLRIASPLDTPGSVLACPPLIARSTPEPSGWLGAAAASLACERARLSLGGAAGRTLAPAELLDLPRQPTDAFPLDPYGAPDARARAIEAARSRASVYLDGEIVAERDGGFRVVLALRDRSGASVGDGQGSGAALYESVRAAMRALGDGGALPQAEAVDAQTAAWMGTAKVDAALAHLDVVAAMSENGPSLAKECASVADVASLSAPTRSRVAWLCRYISGVSSEALPVPAAAESPSATTFLEETRVRLLAGASADLRGDAAHADRLLAQGTTEIARHALATVSSCAHGAIGEVRQAEELALLAIQADPRAVATPECSEWEQLSVVSKSTRSAGAVTRAYAAWQPWSSFPWWYHSIDGAEPQRALEFARRAQLLAPENAESALNLAGLLILNGERQEARGLAVALAGTGKPVLGAAASIIFVRLDASEAQFAAALRRARQGVREMKGSGFLVAQRVELALVALRIARVLGQAPEVAEEIVQLFVTTEPDALETVDAFVLASAAEICAEAPVAAARTCFTRLNVLAARQHSQTLLPELDSLLDGAARYAQNDMAGATRAWRPLLRGSGMMVARLSDQMATAFAATGDADLAERVDERAMAHGELNGVSMAHVRAAERALASGDRARARALAARVLDAWSTADERPPSMARMAQIAAGTAGAR